MLIICPHVSCFCHVWDQRLCIDNNFAGSQATACGLYGFNCTVELRNQRNSFWSEQFRSIYFNKDEKGEFLRMLIPENFANFLTLHGLSAKWCIYVYEQDPYSFVWITDLCISGTVSIKVLLQWNSTSVYTSCTYSTYLLGLALGTFMCHFISACLVCHTS